MNVFERKYCIVDNAGNYYRVNEYDELSVAKGEESAAWFDILEANKRINNSGMGKSLRTVAANKSIASRKEKKDMSKDGSSEEEFQIRYMDLAQMAKQLHFLYRNLAGYQAELRDKQLEVDEEICDIMHFVELYERDEAQSLELMDQLQDCRERRRSIKDELYRAELFTRIFNTGGMGNVLKDVNRQIENMEVREYVPRRLHGLFVQGVKRDYEAEQMEKDIAQEAAISIQEDEETMDEKIPYERIETALDSRITDWNRIVSKQAEIFENIEQYAVNLDLDLQELDAQIENLMETCEEATCNVTQGYKMFKQLKELRLQRKEKLMELNRVQTIMGCFDCGAMADTYRYLVEMLCGRTEQGAIPETVDPINDESAEESVEVIAEDTNDYMAVGDKRDSIVTIELENQDEDVREAM